jgi:phosphoribosylanthranilate isomerase
VDAEDEVIDRIATEVRPDWLQLHGKETVERARAIRARTGLKIIKAVSVAVAGDAERAADYLDAGSADLLLFDAKPPPDAVLPGGNGVPFDWRLLDPPAVRRPFMLSGGLTPENVTEAVRLTRAAFVDVSSGVESSPGVKDAELIRRFIAAARR